MQGYAAQRTRREERKASGQCVRCATKLVTRRFVACLSCRHKQRDAKLRFNARRVEAVQ